MRLAVFQILLASPMAQGAVLCRDAHGKLARRDGLLDQLGQLFGGRGRSMAETVTAAAPGSGGISPVVTIVAGSPVAQAPDQAATPSVVSATTNANGNGVGVSTAPIASSLLPTTTIGVAANDGHNDAPPAASRPPSTRPPPSDIIWTIPPAQPAPTAPTAETSPAGASPTGAPPASNAPSAGAPPASSSPAMASSADPPAPQPPASSASSPAPQAMTAASEPPPPPVTASTTEAQATLPTSATRQPSSPIVPSSSSKDIPSAATIYIAANSSTHDTWTSAAPVSTSTSASDAPSSTPTVALSTAAKPSSPTDAAAATAAQLESSLALGTLAMTTPAIDGQPAAVPVPTASPGGPVAFSRPPADLKGYELKSQLELGNLAGFGPAPTMAQAEPGFVIGP